MKRVAVLAFTLASASACGPAEPAVAPAPVNTVPAQPASSPPPPVQPLPAATPPPPAATAAESALPPPKPTTISLAHTGDDKLDAVLAQGDKAFEDADYTKAAASYKIAMTMAPKLAHLAFNHMTRIAAAQRADDCGQRAPIATPDLAAQSRANHATGHAADADGRGFAGTLDCSDRLHRATGGADAGARIAGRVIAGVSGRLVGRPAGRVAGRVGLPRSL